MTETDEDAEMIGEKSDLLVPEETYRVEAGSEIWVQMLDWPEGTGFLG